MYIKYKSGSICETSQQGNYITLSEYNKGNYEDFVKVPVTEEKEVDDSIYRTNEKGEQELVLKRTKLVSVPVTKVVKALKGKTDDGEEIFEEVEEVQYNLEKVKKNIYDATGVVIIPDNSKVLTEDEYEKEMEKMKAPKEVSVSKKK